MPTESFHSLERAESRLIKNIEVRCGQHYYDHSIRLKGQARRTSMTRSNTSALRLQIPYGTSERATDASPDFFSYQVLLRAYLTVEK
jgi:hypothetical protein